MKGRIKKTLMVLVVMALLGAGILWYTRRDLGGTVMFRTAQVTRGDLVTSIDATGTVEPEQVIDVGAQVAGKIVSFGKDARDKTVDYGSPVEEGMVLARIDDSLYLSEAAQAEAQVQVAQANVQRTERDLGQLQAKHYQAERDWARAQKLGPSEALAQSSFDAYKTAYETTRANVAVGEAVILQAKATVAQAEAARTRAQRNLEYCTIISPVKGVIIDRRVNIGQTVVSSMSAPSLFLLAKDLTRMQIWVAVNEADIGKIHAGQRVRFTADTFPDETFEGKVGKIRLNASMNQNVVTYTVEIVTDNSNGRLLPYLTAKVQFELERRENVLLAPNAALRWNPALEQVAPEFRQAQNVASPKVGRKKGRPSSPEGASQEMPSDPGAEAPAGSKSRRRTGAPAGGADETARGGVLWAAEGQYVRPVQVGTGPTNGVLTVVAGQGLTEGLAIVTGVNAEGAPRAQAASRTADTAETTNPFAPKLPRPPEGGKFRR